MPVYAAKYWRQKEKQYVLPKKIIEAVDACNEGTGTSKNHLKQFLTIMEIRSFEEMDYPLRKAFQEYLRKDCHLKSISSHLLVYDRVKQTYIREQMKTLAGRRQCQWRLEEKILFIPYHSDQDLAKEFDTVRNRENMVWDFAQPAEWHLKEQIFVTLNAILEQDKEMRKREHHLTGLQYLYSFCIKAGIADIETIDLSQEQAFIDYLKQIVSESKIRQLVPILNICRKNVFLQNKEINWNATVWYVERLNLPKHRINPSRSLATVSFKEIAMPENRKFAQEYMKYQVGITGQAFSTIATRYTLIQKFLMMWYKKS